MDVTTAQTIVEQCKTFARDHSFKYPDAPQFDNIFLIFLNKGHTVSFSLEQLIHSYLLNSEEGTRINLLPKETAVSPMQTRRWRTEEFLRFGDITFIPNDIDRTPNGLSAIEWDDYTETETKIKTATFIPRIPSTSLTYLSLVAGVPVLAMELPVQPRTPSPPPAPRAMTPRMPSPVHLSPANFTNTLPGSTQPAIDTLARPWTSTPSPVPRAITPRIPSPAHLSPANFTNTLPDSTQPAIDTLARPWTSTPSPVPRAITPRIPSPADLPPEKLTNTLSDSIPPAIGALARSRTPTPPPAAHAITPPRMPSPSQLSLTNSTNILLPTRADNPHAVSMVAPLVEPTPVHIPTEGNLLDDPDIAAWLD